MATDLPQNFAWVESMKKYEGNPIIRPHGKWAADLVFNPAAIVKDDQVLLLCRCVNLADKRRGKKCWSVSSLVWARSNDGINFELDDEPLLYPDENCKYDGGFEDPRIVYIPEEEVYILTYTGVSSMKTVHSLLRLSWQLQKTLKTGSFTVKNFPHVRFV